MWLAGALEGCCTSQLLLGKDDAESIEGFKDALLHYNKVMWFQFPLILLFDFSQTQGESRGAGVGGTFEAGSMEKRARRSARSSVAAHDVSHSRAILVCSKQSGAAHCALSRVSVHGILPEVRLFSP